MDRRYEKIEVGRLYKKSTSEGTQNTIGSKSRLGSEAWGSSTRDRERSAPRLQQTERLALLGTMAATFAHEVGNPSMPIDWQIVFRAITFRSRNL